ncbi:hypothetical protein CKM354_001010100 [Cercospora kikuchii]|uniref:Uncharacterized protein n=1 Tax=Cercospora kikuchii TaxID=84275 RepID=A0A9P3CQB4_9PEZI|nr:uncharacterized protein CKM354_001010100 [Cercospora kikuchii]GIZ46999.1 hypothetical protein CKM354_001010100 [Cercospora kikuchii]
MEQTSSSNNATLPKQTSGSNHAIQEYDNDENDNTGVVPPEQDVNSSGNRILAQNSDSADLDENFQEKDLDPDTPAITQFSGGDAAAVNDKFPEQTLTAPVNTIAENYDHQMGHTDDTEHYRAELLDYAFAHYSR